MLADVHAAIEGPGSVPIKFGALSGRGMLNVGAEVRKIANVAGIEDESVVLFIAQDRLPGVDLNERIQVGTPDLAAMNAVTGDDPTYRVLRRSPVDDGLIHALFLEGNPQ